MSKKPLTTTHSPLPTISKWLQKNTQKLKVANIESAQLDCKVMLENVLGKDRAWIAAHNDEPLDSTHLQKLDTFITQRLQRTPLAYILGSKEFYGRDFLVSPDVLIPRPESEAIITMLKGVMKQLRAISDTKNDWIPDQVGNDRSPARSTTHDPRPTILDIGTGSGCLAITTKLEIPHAAVIGVDISKDALKIAEKNAQKLAANITFIQSDLLSSIPDTQSSILLANLPYVPEGLITSEEITKEPSIALFSGDDGLNHYRHLAENVSRLKNKPFVIITESLTSQHEELAMIMKNAGYDLDRTETLVQLFMALNAAELR